MVCRWNCLHMNIILDEQPEHFAQSKEKDILENILESNNSDDETSSEGECPVQYKKKRPVFSGRLL